jgi:hypothetical protein
MRYIMIARAAVKTNEREPRDYSEDDMWKHPPRDAVNRLPVVRHPLCAGRHSGLALAQGLRRAKPWAAEPRPAKTLSHQRCAGRGPPQATAPARGSAVGEFAQRPTEPVGHPGHVGPRPIGLRPSGELPRTSTRRSRNLAKKATPLEPIIDRPWIPEMRTAPIGS